MSGLFAFGRRVASRLRWSMATQISVSIAATAMVLIVASGFALERLFLAQLRIENELILITNLDFVRDELVADGFDLARVDRTVISRIEERMYRLRAALYDEAGRRLARSPSYPFDALPSGPIVDSDALSRDLIATPVGDGTHERYAPLTRILYHDDQRYRTIVGRVRLPPAAAGHPASVLVALAVETTSMPLVLRDRFSLALALFAALAIASLLGTLIARRIVAGARRLGTASSRIGAEALGERLSLDETPSELVESTVAFNRMLDRLQASFDRLSAFSSDLAHDLRTPINNLLGEAQVALSRPRTPDEYRAVIESSVEEYERLSRMIGNMLFLARADNAEAVVSPIRMDVTEVLKRVLSYFELIAEERGITLEMTVDADATTPREVCADEDMLVRALSNLVSNALRHATPGSRVDVSARVDATSGCTIEVSNDGEPIPLALQSRIFERFYRGDAAREGSSTSSGLGLAIVRSIMDLHHGTVGVRSAPGDRTTFTLTFPPENRC